MNFDFSVKLVFKRVVVFSLNEFLIIGFLLVNFDFSVELVFKRVVVLV